MSDSSSTSHVVVFVGAFVAVTLCGLRMGLVMARSRAASSLNSLRGVGATSCDCNRGRAVSTRASLGAVG